jgi:hypothetical protein
MKRVSTPDMAGIDALYDPESLGILFGEMKLLFRTRRGSKEGLCLLRLVLEHRSVGLHRTLLSRMIMQPSLSQASLTVQFYEHGN